MTLTPPGAPWVRWSRTTGLLPAAAGEASVASARPRTETAIVVRIMSLSLGGLKAGPDSHRLAFGPSRPRPAVGAEASVGAPQ